jgi:APA family basic amino acid/polyamine antiporter
VNESRQKGLPRTLGLWSAVSLVVGITIGSGIFRTPAGIARLLPNPKVMLAVWVLGGLITLCGALSFAGLGAMLPETGGFYAYLREGWGRPVAFLFGWSELVLIRASALGGMSIVFGEYGLRTFGVDPAAHPIAARALAAAAIGCAATANVLGANIGAAIVGWSTAAKFSALALLAGCSFALGRAHGASADHFTAAAGSTIGVGSIGLALISILWAYDGFGDVSFAGGEIKDPRRNLPRAIVFGTLAIIGLYLVTNAAYLYMLPVDAVGRSPLVAADVMQALFGRAGVVLVSLFVMISSFSSVNGSMLAAPRVFFAMAGDGLFFKSLARVHPRFETPYVAILLSALLGVALVMSRSFEALTSTFVLAIWPFYALSVAAIFRLRRRRPDLGSHNIVGYPFVPGVFIAAVVWFVFNALVTDPMPTIATFVLILAGIPVYAAFFSSNRAGFR